MKVHILSMGNSSGTIGIRISTPHFVMHLFIYLFQIITYNMLMKKLYLIAFIQCGRKFIGRICNNLKEHHG